MYRKKTEVLASALLVVIIGLLFFCERSNPYDPKSKTFIKGDRPHVAFVDKTMSAYLYDTISIPVVWSDTAVGGVKGAIKKFYIDWHGDTLYNDSVDGTDADTLVLRKAFPAGEVTVRIRALDFDGNTGEADSMKLSVLTSSPRIVTIGGSRAIRKASLCTLSVSASDTGGKIQTFFWARNGLDFNDSTSVGSLQVSYSDTGAKTVLVKARDNKGVVSGVDTFHITVYDKRGAVLYDGNGNTGGNVPTDANTYVAGQPVIVLGNTGNLVKSGDVFSGWNTSPNGSGANYSAGAAFLMDTASAVLYAQWTVNPTFTVAYNGNGNTGGTVPADTANYSLGQSVTVLANTGSLVKTGNTFVGWNTEANGSGIGYAAEVSFFMGSANVTLYAQWTGDPTYTVIYNGNGNSGGTVPVDSNNYLSGATVTVRGNTNALVKTGNTFIGWDTIAVGGGTVLGTSFTMKSANVTLYAQWTAKTTYTVTYNGNNNTSGNVPPDANNYLSGAAVVVLGNTGLLVKTGYTFVGWDTNAAGSGTAYAPGAPFTMGTFNVVLYAQWASTYTVSYDGNGNTGGGVPADNNNYAQGQTVTVRNVGTLVKTGYAFTGWNTQASSGGTSYPAGATFSMGTANVTLYAQWTPTYSITYNGNGNTGGAVPTDANAYQQGATAIVKANTGTLVKTGNTFAGWNTAADGSGVKYVENATLIIDKSNVILYAMWVPVTSTSKALTSFSFTTPTATGAINEAAKTVAVTVPYGTNVTALVATFTTTGASVKVGSVAQVSGTTANDFTNPVTYTVVAANGSTQAYMVTVTVALNPAKALTAFGFTSPAVTGTINETAKTVAVTVPYGTSVTALVAAFATTGASVKVGSVAQVSGMTANNFTNPVTDTVVAADGSTQAYTVTVTVATNTSKALTSFSFTNPSVTGTINETAKTVAVTVPYGTNVTALVATFATTGASVKVGSVAQVSGTTANNFTNPVTDTVVAANGSTQAYTVTVTIALNSAKALTAFRFSSPSATGAINEAAKTVAVTVPYGTNVTALVATFATTGASVNVGSVAQASGTTANDFRGLVTYTVVAADGSPQAYTVAVTIAPNSAKALTAFGFTIPAVTGTINETAKTVAVTVPYGTNVTALVAAFATTGASVKVGSVTQVSGMTANNFTNPVTDTVVAADGSTQAYVVIVTAAPSVPTLSAPANGAAGVAVSPSLSWSAVSGAITYHLQVSTASDFSAGIVSDDSTLTVASKALSGLANSTLYYWRVNAKNAAGTSAWSTASSFTTIVAAPAAPVLTAPANNATGVAISQTVSWGTVTGAATYRIQVSTASDFSTGIVADDSTLTTASKALSGLANNTKYYWQVKAKNAGGTSTWSTAFSFTTVVAVSGVPVNTTPTNAATGVPLNPTLTWSAVAGAVTYRVQVSTVSDLLTGIVIDDSTLTIASKALSALTNNTLYYWRVNAKNGGGTSAWSTPSSFTTIIAVPGTPVLSTPANNATGVTASPIVTWAAVTGAATYRVQVSTSSNFPTGIFIDDSTLTTGSKALGTLSNATKYYWRVNAKNAGGTSGWATANSFTTIVKFALSITFANGTVTPNPTGSPYDSGTVVSLTAAPATGYSFTGWSGGGLTGTTNPASVTMNSAKSVTATFTQITYQLTMAAGTGGTVTVPASSPTTVAYGAATTITASASAGYSFVNWTVTTGTGNATFGNANSASTTVTLTGSATVQANFAINTCQLTVNTTTGGTITAPATSPATVNYGAATTITASASAGYSFVNWTVTTGTGNATFGNANSASTTVTLTGSATVQANFAINTCQLTVNTTTGGTITAPATSPATVNYGAATTITASASAGYSFVNWTVTTGTGNATFGNANSASTTVTLTGSATVQANFAIITYQLTVNPTTGGTITTPATSPAIVNYNVGTTITASLSAGYKFVNWTKTSGSCSITDSTLASTTVKLTSGNATVQANFAVITYQLTVNPTTGGTITAPASSPATVNYNVATTITASPSAGYKFVNWTKTSGSCSITDSTLASTTATLTSGNATVQANFAVITYQLTVNPTTGGTISAPATSPATVNYGDATAIVATPSEGYSFVNWTVSGTGASVANANDVSTTATLIGGDATVTANFTIAAPIISGVVPGDSSATVSWNEVTGATSYNIYYAQNTTVDKNGIKVEGVTPGSSITGLDNGTTYAFAVTTVISGVESGLSNVLTAIPNP